MSNSYCGWVLSEVRGGVWASVVSNGEEFGMLFDTANAARAYIDGE